ncbi:MAG: carbonic anhydrase [Alphaproteobacteria bacterium]|nr:carbonic anhydrase [Alphaproteobacteria bacterium]
MVTLTKEMRDCLSPNQALDLLKEGNRRFVTNLKVNRNLLQQVNDTSDGQYPFAFILSCIDSRTSAELIFDQGLGDIFSCRIAGNILNNDILGSMEFACKVSGAKVVLVLGHSECGAIKGACSHVKMGHLTNLLKKIRVVVKRLQKKYDYDPESNNFLDLVTQENVKNVLKQIPKESEIIRDLIKNKKIILVGAIYDVSSGKVDFYQTKKNKH